MNHTWKSALQFGTVAALLSFAGVLGGFDQPKDNGKDKPAAKESDTKKSDEKKATKHEFKIEDGMYAEACSCKPPCPCELMGASMGCEGVGAYELKKATYEGKEISGSKIAYALNLAEKDGWVHVYVDQKDPKKHDAAVAFAKGALAVFGNITLTKDADIKIEEKDSKYTISVDDGKVMKLQTKPTMGGDGKTPMTHTNTHDALNPTFYQATIVAGEYKGGGKNFKLAEGRNSYFNDKMKSKGEV
jgi:hypothetical protein